MGFMANGQGLLLVPGYILFMFLYLHFVLCMVDYNDGHLCFAHACCRLSIHVILNWPKLISQGENLENLQLVLCNKGSLYSQLYGVHKLSFLLSLQFSAIYLEPGQLAWSQYSITGQKWWYAVCSLTWWWKMVFASRRTNLSISGFGSRVFPAEYKTTISPSCPSTGAFSAWNNSAIKSCWSKTRTCYLWHWTLSEFACGNLFMKILFFSFDAMIPNSLHLSKYMDDYDFFEQDTWVWFSWLHLNHILELWGDLILPFTSQWH